MEKFLTVFPPAEKVHLYKDVGMIPYCLARYCGYESHLLYFEKTPKIEDAYYEQYVNLIPIAFSANKLIQFYYLIQWIRLNAKKYDIINFYHLTIRNLIFPIIFKIFNKKCKIYFKLDLDEFMFEDMKPKTLKKRIKNSIKMFVVNNYIDVISVETKSFYEKLKNIKQVAKKLIYLPNGLFFEDIPDLSLQKQNIILTVGRIGTEQKNNELLANAIAAMPREKLKGWKVLFVGPVTAQFIEYIQHVCDKKAYLRDTFVIEGNIADKNKLYQIYASAKVFCLTSRWESFGLVLLEAMYFRNYIITTNYPTAYDLVNEGIGKIIKNEDSAALTRCIEEYIDGHVDGQCSENAKQHVTKNFNWVNIVSELSVYLQKIE